MIELFFALVIKHVWCDLGLQNYLTGRKDKYIGLGHYHYLQHGLGTFIVVTLFVNPYAAFFASVFDYVVHWHIDFSKQHVNRWLGLEYRSKNWWWMQCVDQTLHHSTYFAIAYYFTFLTS